MQVEHIGKLWISRMVRMFNMLRILNMLRMIGMIRLLRSREL